MQKTCLSLLNQPAFVTEPPFLEPLLHCVRCRRAPPPSVPLHKRGSGSPQVTPGSCYWNRHDPWSIGAFMGDPCSPGSAIVMSCSRPCGARRCRWPISRTPPSCLAGHDASLAYAWLTGEGVGQEASIHIYLSPVPMPYRQYTPADGIGPQASDLAAVSIPYAHHGASCRIISHYMQSINHTLSFLYASYPPPKRLCLVSRIAVFRLHKVRWPTGPHI